MNDADSLISSLHAKLVHLDPPLQEIQLYIPDPDLVRQWYEELLAANAAARFPFWAKLWPSAIALAEFISTNSSLVTGKKVLEVAGGLGLPSLVAASFAREVIFTDVDPDAVALFSKVLRVNNTRNVQAFSLDWNSFPRDLSADVLLLSDVNYDEGAFQPLHSVLQNFLDRGSLVLLTTPMRLIGRRFVEPLLPFVIDQKMSSVELSGTHTMITILALHRD
jgi:methyltransferase-like protein 23